MEIKLEKAWPKYTAQSIALELGVTRNAVILKAGRLGLPAKKPVIKMPIRQKKPNTRVDRTFGAMPIMKDWKVVENGKPFATAAYNECSFMLGVNQDGAAMCCGEKATHRSYCENHYKICYTKSERPRR